MLIGNESKDVDKLVKRLADEPNAPKTFLIFHETSISGPHVMDYSPVPRPSIYLKDLMVTYEPLEKVFAAE